MVIYAVPGNIENYDGKGFFSNVKVVFNIFKNAY